MLTGTHYRGHSLSRVFDQEARTYLETWVVGDDQAARSWNDTLAFVNSIATEPKPPTILCWCCGQIELQFGGDGRLAAMRRCFSCDFWIEILTKPETLVLRGGSGKKCAYSIAPDLRAGESESCAGFGGAKHVIQFADGSEVVTHNLWGNGEIPERFLELSDACKQGAFK